MMLLAVNIILLTIVISDRRTEKLAPQAIYEQYLHAHYKRLARSIDQNSVVFLGSSAIQALPVGEISPNAYNLGIGGEKLEGLYRRVTEYKNITQAKLIVIAAGFNDLCSSSQEQLAAQFSEIVEFFPGNKPMIVAALQPAKVTSLCAELALKLLEYNSFLRQYCKQRSQCKFIDLPQEILQSSSEQNIHADQYFESDKIHLNEKGYDVWVKKIREYAKPVVSG